MAEAEAEAAFLSSMQAMNENNGSYEVSGGPSEQQIDSSSDEYDPAQDVQDFSQSSSLPVFNPVSSVDFRKNDVLSPPSSRPLSSLPSTHGVTSGPISENSSFPQSTSMKVNDQETLSTVPSGLRNIDGVNATEKGAEISLSSNNHTHLSREGASLQNSAPDPSAANDVSTESTESPLTIDTTGADGSILHPTDYVLQPSGSVPTATANNPPGGPTTNSSPSPISAMPKARLPHDKIGILEDRIKEDEKGDLDAWLSLIAEHRRRGKLDDARKVYQRFFAIFPSAAEQWIAYIQMENEAQNRSAVEVIFNNTLMQIPNVQLWSAYLDHIRRHYNVTTDMSGNARKIIIQAYDLALKHVGIDKESGKLWQDCIQFHKSGPGTLGGSSWQDQQKMDLLRKTYQSAVCVPTQAVESLWREYNAFEMGLNKMTGRKFLQDQSPAHMTARSSNTELHNITRDLKRTTLPVLPPALGFDGDVEYTKQVEIWKRWIQWEKDDPLVLKQDDLAAYKDRIVFVYKQALMALRFWPEMWFEAAEFCFNNDLDVEGNDFLNQGISANPESCLLAFKRADRLELSTSSEDGDEGLIKKGVIVREPYDKVLDALYDLVDKTNAREAREIARIESQYADANPDRPNGTKAEEDDQDFEGDSTNQAEQRKKQQIDNVKNLNSLHNRLIQKTLSHAWIALMRAIRRVQGKGKVNAPIGGSRQILTDARKRGRIMSDIWVAAALLEFHMGEGEAAKRIFERGAKLYPEDEGFALEYIKHLLANNDHTNARVVFETTVGRLAQKPGTLPKAKSLYAFFHAFESGHGELSQVIKLEKRIGDLFPEDPRLASFSQRFLYEGFDPTAIRLILSPGTQARTKIMPSVEAPSVHNSPPNNYVQPTYSPKRPLPFEESDTEMSRPRKIVRGESPLKGAAGRRLDQQKRSRLPNEMANYEGHSNDRIVHPPLLPREVLFLLSIVPNASTYHATKLKPTELVRVIRDLNIPERTDLFKHPLPLQEVQREYPQMASGQYNGAYPYQR